MHSNMFKKRNRKNIRTRKNNDEGLVEEATPIPNAPAAPTPSPSITRSQQPSQGKGILSFDDEINDGVSFKVKKSNLSEKMARKRGGREKREEKDNNKVDILEEDDYMATDNSSSNVIVPQPGFEDNDSDSDVGVASIGRHLETGVVPDAAMIHAIRKKRELAREMGVASVEYLPLSSRGGGNGYGKAKGKSRLIREDEYDKSDEEEEGGREGEGKLMNFGTTNEPTRQLQVLSGLENVCSSGSEDEELQRWEEDQINKGIKASNQLQTEPKESHAHQSMDPLMQSFVYGTMATEYSPAYPYPSTPYYQSSQYTSTQQPVKPVIPDKLVPITLESLKAKLTNRLQDIKEVHERHAQQLEQIEGDILCAQKEMGRMEGDIPSLEEGYAFYQQMRSYTRDLLSCLAVKNAHIKALDQRMVDILRKRAELLSGRRRQDVADEAEECAAGGKGISIGPEVEARQIRSVEREARRRRRRERRQRNGITEHDEGTSSDDELLETNRLKFVSDTDAVRERLKEVFTDVMEDFHKLHIIKTRFEQWKWGYSNGYQQAFVSMCLPKLFAPFVSLQLIDWNPLQPDCPALDSMKWFQVLLFYGHKEEEVPLTTDEDNLLLPSIIDRVVIPKLTGIIENVWDPLSTSQTNCLVVVTMEILNEYCTGHTPHQDDLVTAVNKRLKQVLNQDLYIPLMSSIQLQNTNTHDYHFYQRQFWSSVKLLGNVLQWRDVLPGTVLQQLVLDGIVNRYLLLSLQNSPANKLTVRKTEILFKLLPEVWFNGNRGNKPPLLQGLKRCLSILGDTLKREGMGGGEHERKVKRSLEERVLSLQEQFFKKS